MAVKLPPLDKLDPAEAWKPWAADAKHSWDLKWAGHLYRRAAFGAMREELGAAMRAGMEKTLDLLFQGTPKQIEEDGRLAKLGESKAQAADPHNLRAWWMERMLRGGPPLREKLTLFWHNHFATSISKVQSPALMYRQNELLRKHALGEFRPLLLEVSKDPAMLVWLDSNSNVKGKPNENYAREVMELFSLGVGNYTEKDVQAAARAFTGWHTDGERFTFKAELHDDESKTFLGQTGDLNGGDIVRIVLDQPAAARFLVRKLYRFFVSEAANPPDAFLQPLADAFRKSDYNIAALVKTMLSARHFYSDHAYRQRVKTPVEFVLGCVRATECNVVTPGAMVARLELLGQHLFAPPNVKGWEGGTAWLNTATVIARHNFAHALCMGGGELNLGDPNVGSVALAPDPSALARRARIGKDGDLVAFYADLMLQGDIGKAARAKLVAHVAAEASGPEREQRIRELIHALMTMPEYQLA
jgi:uncharacterized protein (DUF1800 family)